MVGFSRNIRHVFILALSPGATLAHGYVRLLKAPDVLPQIAPRTYISQVVTRLSSPRRQCRFPNTRLRKDEIVDRVGPATRTSRFRDTYNYGPMV